MKPLAAGVSMYNRIRQTFTAAFVLCTLIGAHAQQYLEESSRGLPIAYEVDVVIAGATMSAIGAAISAAEAGASVVITTPSNFLAHELYNEGREWIPAEDGPREGLARIIFGDRIDQNGAVSTSSQSDVLRAIEAEFKRLDIICLFATFPCGVLLDDQGAVAGMVMANKAGRQAVVGKYLIDATPMAGLTRLAGIAMSDWPSDPVTVSISCGMETYSDEFVFTEGSWSEMVEARISLLKQNPGTAYCESHYPHLTLPISITGRASVTGAWPGVENIDIGCFIPADEPNLCVLNTAGDLSYENAQRLDMPLTSLRIGERVGAALAELSENRSNPSGVHVKTESGLGQKVTGLESKELLEGHRPGLDYPYITVSQEKIPVYGEYDVIVAGGGTAGSTAGISAAQYGAKTIIVEKFGVLGGVGTLGHIGSFYAGFRGGTNDRYNLDPEVRANRLFEDMAASGAECLFTTFVSGALVRGNEVVGVVVATPFGRRAILGKVVIDATGDADVCAAAGAPYVFLNNGEFEVTETSAGGQEHATIPIDPTDVWSSTQYLMINRVSGPNANKSNRAPLQNVRESRQVIGDFTISYARGLRKEYDAIVSVRSGMDPHGFCTFTDRGSFGIHSIPYSATLPRGFEGILVAGRSISITHNAQTAYRMQPDMMNLGHALGYVASLSAAEDTPLRSIDVTRIQHKMIEVGNLQVKDIGENTDYTDEELNSILRLSQVCTRNNAEKYTWQYPERSLTFLREEFAQNPSVCLARLICRFGGDDNAAEFLAAHIDTLPLSGGGGYMQFSCMDKSDWEIDNDIHVLGYCSHEKAIEAVIHKLEELGTSASDLSHTYAIMTSLRRMASPTAVSALKAFLQKPGISGHVLTVDMPQTGKSPQEWIDTDKSEKHMGYMKYLYLLGARELWTAAALYASGDDANGTGEQILRDYIERDWRGILTRYAANVLEGEDVTATSDPRSVTMATVRPADRIRTVSGPGVTPAIILPPELVSRVNRVVVHTLDGRAVKTIGSLENFKHRKISLGAPLRTAGVYVTTIQLNNGRKVNLPLHVF